VESPKSCSRNPRGGKGLREIKQLARAPSTPQTFPHWTLVRASQTCYSLQGRGRCAVHQHTICARSSGLIAAGPETRRVTAAAGAGGIELGADPAVLVRAVLSLDEGCFYKTMPSTTTPGLWQDVYHLRWSGNEVYVKLQIDSGMAVVVQFKRK
jgi:hypothetical protein